MCCVDQTSIENKAINPIQALAALLKTRSDPYNSMSRMKTDTLVYGKRTTKLPLHQH